MFFLLPIGVDYRARRYPVVTFTLMGICIIVFLITVACGAFGDDDAVQQWVYQYLWLTPSKSYWWSYLTSQFVHGGVLHILGNMLFLFLFGSCVEDVIGRMRFAIFYLVCGLFAAFTYILVTPEHFASSVPMGGASGAISGCLGGFLLLRAATRIKFKWVIIFWFRIWHGLFLWPAWLVISFWFLDDLAMTILTRLDRTQSGGVAFAAHVGGVLAGMAIIAVEKARLKSKGGFPQIEYDDEDDEEEEDEPTAKAPTHVTARPRPAVVAIETPTTYLSWEGTNYGPYTSSQIRQMLTQGAIPPNATYWQLGMDGWRTIDELREPGVA